MSRGIEPGGITASRSSARPPATIDATAVTTTAWTTTPAKSVRLRAPIALSTPYRPRRSTVSSAKNSATTTTAMAIVTPMIWLNVERCCSTPGMASTASVMVSDSVASPVAASIAVGDLGDVGVGGRCARRAPGRRRRRAARRGGSPSAPRATSPGRPTAIPARSSSCRRRTRSRSPVSGRVRAGSPCRPRRRRRAVRRRRRPRREPVGRARRRAPARSRTGRSPRGLVVRCPGPGRRAGRRRCRRCSATPGTASTVARVSASIAAAEERRLRRRRSSTMRSPSWARTAPVELRMRPSSRPPRNITSTATSVRMIVAVTKRPGGGPARHARHAGRCGRRGVSRRTGRAALGDARLMGTFSAQRLGPLPPSTLRGVSARD